MEKFKVNKFSIVLLCFAALGCIALLLPLRNLIIDIAEKILGRDLNRVLWQAKLAQMLIFFIAGTLIFACIFQFIKLPVFEKLRIPLFNISESFKLFSNKKFLVFFILLFISLIGIRLYWISQKKSFHYDEVLSIAIANNNEYGFWSGENKFISKQEYSGKTLKELTLWDDPSVKDSFHDIVRMYRATDDTPHTNFYYSLLRLWFTGIKTDNKDFIFRHGCTLNILFFAFSYFFMFILLSKLTDKPFIILLCLAISFLQPATISQTLFLRPYELQSTLFILFALLFIVSLQAINGGKIFETKKNFFIAAFILSLTALTGYFSLFFIAILGIVILHFAVKNKRSNTVSYFVYLFLIGLVFTQCLYLSYFVGPISYRGTEALSKLSSAQVFQNLKESLFCLPFIFLGRNIFLIAAYFISFILFIISIIQYKKNPRQEPFVLFCAVLIWCFITIYFAPYKTQRYVAPAFPLFSILVLSCFTKYSFTRFLSVLASIMFFLSVLPLQVKQGFTNITISHLDDEHINTLESIKNKNIPVVITINSRWDICATFIPYLQDEQQCYFIDEISDIAPLPLPQKFWLCIFGNGLDESTTNTFHLSVIDEYTHASHKGYLIEKDK